MGNAAVITDKLYVSCQSFQVGKHCWFDMIGIEIVVEIITENRKGFVVGCNYDESLSRKIVDVERREK